MAILNIDTNVVGAVGVNPRIIHINTSDALATIIATGYLNKAVQNGLSVSNQDMALVYGTDLVDGLAGSHWFQVDVTGANTSLIASVEPGSVVLPVTANHIAAFTDTDGTIGDDPATAINGGNLQAGLSGTAGYLASFPGAASKGSLRVTGVANTGDTVTTISNASMGQASVVSIPDPSAATANFLLDAGPTNIVAFQQCVGVEQLILATAGTWTVTRVAEADYSLVHTPANDTSILSFDITPQLQAVTDRGFELVSIDVIYSVGVLALDAHTFSLNTITYADNSTNSVTPIGFSGSLATATQANPYVSNLALNAPDFLIENRTKYVMELTVDAAATSTYSLYGFVLHFNKTIA
jgi:hypothetical protein